MGRAFGEGGVVLISVLVAIAAMTTANSSVFTGARTSYAFGSEVSRFRWLGHWHGVRRTPVNALLLQGAVALALVGLGTLDVPAIGLNRQGFETMVGYTAPVFWTFFLLTGVSLFVLRRKSPSLSRPFRVPLYPITPAIFCLSSGYLLYSSLAYTGPGALLGVGVLAVGGVLLLLQPAGSLDR
jgi:amino acid transporter